MDAGDLYKLRLETALADSEMHVAAGDPATCSTTGHLGGPESSCETKQQRLESPNLLLQLGHSPALESQL